MQQSLLYSSDSLDIEYNQLHAYLYCNWKGNQSQATVKTGGEKILEILQQQHCSKILNDNRQVEGSWSTVAQWVASDLFTRLLAAGLTRLAWIVSPNPLAHVSTLIALINSSKRSGVVHTFWDEELAKHWLLQLPGNTP